MLGWKFNKEVIKYSTDNQLIKELDLLGSDGWEMICIDIEKGDRFNNHVATVMLKKSFVIDN